MYSFQQTVPKQLSIHLQKNVENSNLTLYTKVNYIDQQPKCKAKIIKLLEDNMNVDLSDLGLGNVCGGFDITDIAQAIKGKIGKLYFTKFWDFVLQSILSRKFKNTMECK